MCIACPGRIGKDKCERKAYPHKICPDRNRIWLRANKIENPFRYVRMLFLANESFFWIESDNHYPGYM